MELITPKSISGAIMDLIEDADEKVIIISPYVNLRYWTKLKNSFAVAAKRGVKIEFYVREDQPNCIEDVRSINIEPILIQNLHTKLYLNERFAIVSSMNLVYGSDTKSLDIGYKTNTKDEHKELMEYYERHIKRSTNIVSPKFSEIQGNLYDYISDTISEKLSLGVRIFYDEPNSYTLNTRNRYNFFITKDRQLRISGIFSQAQFDYALNNPQLIVSNDPIEYELVAATEGYYNTIWATIGKDLESRYLDSVVESEKEVIANSIIQFVSTVEDVKNKYQEFAYPAKPNPKQLS